MTNPLTCPIPTTFTSPSGATVRVLARAWGITLTHTSGSGWGSGYWTNSSGGGSGLNAGSDAVALEIFHERVAKRQAYWRGLVGPESIIVGGMHYRDGGWASSDAAFRGFGGHEWGIKCLADGSTWRTNNLWHQGDLPPEMGLADTHVFVPPLDSMPKSPPRRPSEASTPSVEQSDVIRLS